MRLRLIALPLIAALAFTMSGCGTERSPKAFCAVYWQQKHEYLAKYNHAAATTQEVAKKNPLLGAFAGVATSLQAIGDVEIIFDKLDKVAPDDIEPDVAAIRDSLQKQTDSAGDAVHNPLGTLVNGLVSSLTTMGSWQRVSDYVVTECGEKGATSQ